MYNFYLFSDRSPYSYEGEFDYRTFKKCCDDSIPCASTYEVWKKWYEQYEKPDNTFRLRSRRKTGMEIFRGTVNISDLATSFQYDEVAQDVKWDYNSKRSAYTSAVKSEDSHLFSIACEHSNDEMITLLLEMGIDVTVDNNKAIQLCIDKCNFERADLLLQYGANLTSLIDTQSVYPGCEPYFIKLFRDFYDYFYGYMDSNYQKIKYLIERGADPNYNNGQLLGYIFFNRHVSCINNLSENSPLFKVADLLISHGVSLQNYIKKHKEKASINSLININPLRTKNTEVLELCLTKYGITEPVLLDDALQQIFQKPINYACLTTLLKNVTYPLTYAFIETHVTSRDRLPVIECIIKTERYDIINMLFEKYSRHILNIRKEVMEEAGLFPIKKSKNTQIASVWFPTTKSIPMTNILNVVMDMLCYTRYGSCVKTQRILIHVLIVAHRWIALKSIIKYVKMKLSVKKT